MHAFIDEAGQRSTSARSSSHFIMSAAVVEAHDLPSLAALLARLRLDLGRRPGDTLHWQNIKGHSLACTRSRPWVLRSGSRYPASWFASAS